MGDAVTFAEIFDGDDCVAHLFERDARVFLRSSDNIRKGTLHPAKIPNTRAAEQHDEATGQKNGRPPKLHLPAQQGPAKTINHANHGVKGVKQTHRNIQAVPLPDHGHARAGVSDGGEEETKLNEEWNEVTEV